MSTRWDGRFSLIRSGPQGQPGTPGAGILAGMTPPTMLDGQAGDFYFEAPIARLWGPKLEAGWQTYNDLRGVQGIQGLRGDPGIQGPEGPQGLQGPAGQNGIDGTDGREVQLRTNVAYVQWKYSDESTWTNLILLEELRGPQGVQGLEGPEGPQGLQGIQGPQGATGAASVVPGPKGDTGDQGPQGDTGAAGTNGTNGTNATNSVVVLLFQRRSTVPIAPSVSSTYTFATGVVTGQNNGWAQTIPDGNQPLYVAQALAVGTGATDTIASGDWSVHLLAQDGAQGPQGPQGPAGSGGGGGAVFVSSNNFVDFETTPKLVLDGSTFFNLPAPPAPGYEMEFLDLGTYDGTTYNTVVFMLSGVPNPVNVLTGTLTKAVYWNGNFRAKAMLPYDFAA